MKKLIAVLTVLAFVAGGAFAQITVTGDVTAGITVLSGSNADGDDAVRSGGVMDGFSVEISGEAGGGLFGGWLNLSGSGLNEVIGGGRVELDMGAHAWWQPNRMFRLYVGYGDGMFGFDEIVLWGFYRTAGNVRIVDAQNAWWQGYAALPLHFSQAFYDGFAYWGTMMTIRPTHELTFNFGIPFISMMIDDEEMAETGDVLSALHAQVIFNQPWGRVALTYVGANMWGNANPLVRDESSNGMIFAYLYLRPMDDLSLEFGISFTLPYDDSGSYPIAVGLGAAYNFNPDFGIRARTMAQFGGDNHGRHMSDWFEDFPPPSFGMLFDVLPFFRVTSSITAFASLGIAAVAWDSDGPDTIFDWHFNPYIEIGPDEWGPKFFAGFRLWSEGGSDGHIRWAVPIGVQVSF